MSNLLRAAVVSLVFALNGTAIAAEQTVTLSVAGMTCASCPYIVRSALADVEGVTSVDVSYLEQTATITFDDARSSVADLIKATDEYGYPSEQIASGS